MAHISRPLVRERAGAATTLLATAIITRAIPTSCNGNPNWRRCIGASQIRRDEEGAEATETASTTSSLDPQLRHRRETRAVKKEPMQEGDAGSIRGERRGGR